MRKYTTEYTVYKFEELTPEAKQKALDELTYINVDYSEWGDWILENWKEKLQAMGFTDPEIAYTGFNSQGDGASFTGGIDVKKYLKANKLNKEYKALARMNNTSQTYNNLRGVPIGTIKRDRWHNYVHWNTISVYLEADGEYTPAQETELAKLEAHIQEHAQDLSQDIYKDLDTAYFTDMSDEAIIEAIEANDYEFYEDGRMA